MRERMSERRKPWEQMTVTLVGRVPDVIQVGGGKVTCNGGDPGDPRKHAGTG